MSATRNSLRHWGNPLSPKGFHELDASRSRAGGQTAGSAA